MTASTAPWSAVDVESFINEYYGAWSGTDEYLIMSYYAENVVLQIPGALMQGKEAVRDHFVRPFITAFPGNHHRVKNTIFGPGEVTVEWSFEAQHKGPFAGHAATGVRVSVPGCGVYEYDSSKRQITAGRIYFDVGTLLQTITDLPVNEKAVEALQSNERNLSLTLNTIPTFIAVCRPDGSILSVNQAALDYHGITLQDVQKEDFRSRFFHPDDIERLSEELSEALKRPQPFECEYRALGKDGKYRWFLVRYNPLLDDQGRIDRWYVTAFDIEDRKDTEEALRKSGRQFRLLVETIPALVWRSTPEGDLDYLNRRAVEYLGHTAESLAGGRWLELVHPDHRDATLQRWLQSATTGTAYEDEYQFRRADGQYRWIQSVGEPFLDTEGRIANWYGLVFDIEDRKRAEVEVQKSEANLRQVIDAIPALAWCNLPDGPNEFLNKGWHEYTGLSAEESHGWGWQAAFHPEDLPPLMERWMKMLASGEPDDIEARLRRHDGVYHWFLIRAEPFRDESGKIVRWYGTSTDIDDRKRAEAQIEQAYLRLAEAQRLSKTGSFITDLLVDDHNWSEETYRIFEFDPATKVTVQMIRDRVHPEDLPYSTQ